MPHLDQAGRRQLWKAPEVAECTEYTEYTECIEYTEYTEHTENHTRRVFPSDSKNQPPNCSWLRLSCWMLW